MKKLVCALLCLTIFLTTLITVYAENTQICSNNVSVTSSSFSISSSGKATVNNSYSGITGVTKSATIVTKVQKKFGLIWITVDGGKWIDTSTANSFSKSHSLQLSKTGTYRAHVEFTISGTGGSDDVITKNIEKTYG